MTFYFRPFIHLHGDFPETVSLQEGGGIEKILLDGYIYTDSDFTKWKLVVPNICILNLMTIPSLVNFLQPILILAALPNMYYEIILIYPPFKALYQFKKCKRKLKSKKIYPKFSKNLKETEMNKN